MEFGVDDGHKKIYWVKYTITFDINGCEIGHWQVSFKLNQIFTLLIECWIQGMEKIRFFDNSVKHPQSMMRIEEECLVNSCK